MDNVILDKPSILIHSCCAVCSIVPLTDLANDFNITLYYSNSNLDSKLEFDKRYSNYSVLSSFYKFNIFIDDYDNNTYLELVKAYKDEKEGAKRCELCIYYRLERTFLFAKNKKIDILTSTLSSSPYKNIAMLFSLAKELELKYSIEYLYKDFKKEDGFKKATSLSKACNLYMQKYCGCIYSKKG